MTTSILIRSYQSSDLSACKAMMIDSHKEYEHRPEYFNHAFGTDMADIEKNYLQVSNAHWWVAVSTNDNRIVGQVAVQPLRLGDPIYYQHESLEARDYICELRRMSVAADVQRCNVGSRLLATLFSFAREHGYWQVHLTTLLNMTKACAFYEKHGFVKGNIKRISLNALILASGMQCKERTREVLSNSVIFNPGDIIPEDDQQRMKLPTTKSDYLYEQHFFFAL